MIKSFPYKSLYTYCRSVDICIENKLWLPALILIYSGIDTLGWLNSSSDDATRASFISWVENYMLKSKPLNCTSTDLYAARCGLLHTFTADSSLARKGAARRINYAFGPTSPQVLDDTTEHLNPSDEYVTVHIEDINEAWRSGIITFVEELERDSERIANVLSKSKKFFITMDVKYIENANMIFHEYARQSPDQEDGRGSDS